MEGNVVWFVAQMVVRSDILMMRAGETFEREEHNLGMRGIGTLDKKNDLNEFILVTHCIEICKNIPTMSHTRA